MCKIEEGRSQAEPLLLLDDIQEETISTVLEVLLTEFLRPTFLAKSFHIRHPKYSRIYLEHVFHISFALRNTIRITLALLRILQTA